MFYKAAYLLVYIWYRSIFFVKVYGRENLPEGGVMVCANHSSLQDPVLAALAVGAGNKLRFMAKEELFKNRFFRWLITSLGAFPINRSANDIAAMRKSVEILKAGNKLLIFPEGHRVREGEQDSANAKAGYHMLAVMADISVVPLYITRRKRVFRRISLVFGQPFKPVKMNGAAMSEQARSLMDTIEQLGKAVGKRREG